jgi:hypothetical protein
MKREIDR